MLGGGVAIPSHTRGALPEGGREVLRGWSGMGQFLGREKLWMYGRYMQLDILHQTFSWATA